MGRRGSLGTRYRRLWTAAAISYLGDGVFLTALPLIATAADPRPAGVTIVTTAGSLPWLLFALTSGAIADRFPRLTLMWRVDVARTVITAGLAAAILTGHRSIASLAVAAFALGTCETLFDTASQAVLPELVADDADELTRANGRLETANVAANQFLGPPLGGFLTAIAPALPVLTNAVSFAASAISLRSVGPTRVPRAVGSRTPLRGDIKAGLSWLWNHHRLRTLAVAVGAINFALTASFTLLVLVTRVYSHLGPAGYGLILTAAAVGSTLGGLTLHRLTDRVPATRAIAVVPAVLGIAQIAIAIHPTTAVIAGALAVTGYAVTTWNILTVTYRQRTVPTEFLGRVNSVYRLIAYGTMPLGAVLGGVLATATSLRVPYVVGGALLIATTLLVVPRDEPATSPTAIAGDDSGAPQEPATVPVKVARDARRRSKTST